MNDDVEIHLNDEESAVGDFRIWFIVDLQNGNEPVILGSQGNSAVSRSEKLMLGRLELCSPDHVVPACCRAELRFSS